MDRCQKPYEKRLMKIENRKIEKIKIKTSPVHVCNNFLLYQVPIAYSLLKI